MFLYSSFVISIHLIFGFRYGPTNSFFFFLYFFQTLVICFGLVCIVLYYWCRSVPEIDSYLCKMYMYHVWVSLTNTVRKQLQILHMRQKMDISLVRRRTKKGGIHSWENGDLDEDGVSFLSLSLSLNTTPLFGLSSFCTCTSLRTASVIS